MKHEKGEKIIRQRKESAIEEAFVIYYLWLKEKEREKPKEERRKQADAVKSFRFIAQRRRRNEGFRNLNKP